MRPRPLPCSLILRTSATNLGVINEHLCQGQRIAYPHSRNIAAYWKSGAWLYLISSLGTTRGPPRNPLDERNIFVPPVCAARASLSICPSSQHGLALLAVTMRTSTEVAVGCQKAKLMARKLERTPVPHTSDYAKLGVAALRPWMESTVSKVPFGLWSQTTCLQKLPRCSKWRSEACRWRWDLCYSASRRRARRPAEPCPTVCEAINVVVER
jgi:hypothetical protein